MSEPSSSSRGFIVKKFISSASLNKKILEFNQLSLNKNKSSALDSVPITLSRWQEENKSKRPWTLQEIGKFSRGIAKYGIGNWKKMSQDPLLGFEINSPLRLRDKWRSICRSLSKDSSNSIFKLGFRIWKITDICKQKDDLYYCLDTNLHEKQPIQWIVAQFQYPEWENLLINYLSNLKASTNTAKQQDLLLYKNKQALVQESLTQLCKYKPSVLSYTLALKFKAAIGRDFVEADASPNRQTVPTFFNNKSPLAKQNTPSKQPPQLKQNPQLKENDKTEIKKEKQEPSQGQNIETVPKRKKLSDVTLNEEPLQKPPKKLKYDHDDYVDVETRPPGHLVQEKESEEISMQDFFGEKDFVPNDQGQERTFEQVSNKLALFRRLSKQNSGSHDNKPNECFLM